MAMQERLGGVEEMREDSSVGMGSEDGSTFLWPELPKEVQLKVLSYVPIRELCQVQCVCKEWRDVIRRWEFRRLYDITNSSVQSPSPVICYLEKSYPIHLEWSAYDYAGKTWKKMNSFPLLPQQILKMLNVRLHYSLLSVGGLLCLYYWKEERRRQYIRDYGHFHLAPPGVSTWIVWHPFRNKWKKLPALKHKVSDIAPVFVHAFISDEQAKTYKILVAHYPNSHRYQSVEDGTDRRFVTEIYDSATGNWSDGAEYTLRYFQGFRPYSRQVGLIRRGVLCNGVIYFLIGVHTPMAQNALLFYDIKSDQWQEERYDTAYPIFEWDGRLMSIRSRPSEADEFDNVPRTYFFVERDPVTKSWEDAGIEIPWIKVLNKFRDVKELAIVASGNHLAVTGCATDGSFKIAVYKRAENYWRLPPTGAFSDKMQRCRVEGLIQFTPLLDWRP